MQEVNRSPEDPAWLTPLNVPAASAAVFITNCPAGLRIIYEKCRQADGSIQVNQKWAKVLKAQSKKHGVVGSADKSPVYSLQGTTAATVKGQNGQPDKRVFGATQLAKKQGQLLYCRGLFANAFNGQMLSEAALVLGIAASAVKKRGNEGAWHSLKVRDLFPGWEDTLSTVSNWTRSLQVSITSPADKMTTFIEGLEARAVELQQLIKRIDALTQNLTGYTFLLPECSGLVTLSNGTGGVLSDLVAAKNKPSDSPTAYGGGVLIVIPTSPAVSLVTDLIEQVFTPQEGPPSPTGDMAAAPSALGVGDLPVVPAPDPEPDVL